MKTLSKLILLGSILLTTQGALARDNSIVELTNSNYLSKLLKSDKPVLVKFWASWCRPCRTMTPKFHKAAHTFKGKVTFAEVNVDTQKQVATRYQIRSLPTMILFKKDNLTFAPKSKHFLSNILQYSDDTH
ncbi:MAG: thioredoxin [Epsilonproteobacteria bacterium]|nr:thioredoxin [Campylobacterota bacterium]